MIDDSQIELWINQYLDGQLDPSSAELLNAHLSAYPEHRRLFEQLFALHQAASRQVGGLLKGGKSFDQIYSVAARRSRWSRRRAALWRWSRFAAGLAAGLALAVALQGRLSQPDGYSAASVSPIAPTSVSVNPEIQDVDYYDYTDAAGYRWLIEAVRQPIGVQTAAYYQDL